MSKPPIMLTLDPGFSGTKIIWRISAFKEPELLLMSPEVVEVSREAVDFYKSRRITNLEPENEAWVGYKRKIYAIGYLAQNYFETRVTLNELKYEQALAKVLSAVGIMAYKEKLPRKFDLALALLLPYSEWAARDKFERGVKKALSNFTFRDESYSVNMKLFICVPEGGGHALARGEKMGPVFKTKKIASVMLGYRDVSIILFDKGVIQGKTEHIGMSKMLQLVQSRTFEQTVRAREQRLLETIHSLGKDIKPKNFIHLTLSNNPENRLEESSQISEAVKYARADYWRTVSKFLLTQIPSDIEEIVLGGGTFDYFRNELVNLSSRHFPNADICVAADLEQDVQITFHLLSEDRSAIRLTDAYALSIFLRHQVASSQKEGVQQAGVEN